MKTTFLALAVTATLATAAHAEIAALRSLLKNRLSTVERHIHQEVDQWDWWKKTFNPPKPKTHCQWSSWSPCSAPCGGGTQTRSIATHAANGGNSCAGGSSRRCNTHACPKGTCPEPRVRKPWSAFQNDKAAKEKYMQELFNLMNGGKGEYEKFVERTTIIHGTAKHTVETVVDQTHLYFCHGTGRICMNLKMRCVQPILGAAGQFVTGTGALITTKAAPLPKS